MGRMDWQEWQKGGATHLLIVNCRPVWTSWPAGRALGYDPLLPIQGGQPGPLVGARTAGR